MPDKPGRQRFIAGAVCPRCALMDKIVVDLDTDQRRCISCGFSDERPADNGRGGAGSGVKTVREVPTRVSRAAARRVETPAEVITLVDPKKSS